MNKMINPKGKSYLNSFLVKKTKEALESKGINIKSLPYVLEKQFDILY